ncbi:MAG: class I SAM-dependent methyltransferase [Candidatus Wallbacteria bacterium]|nr:class I SAM-dependent methyltransferase [Candidatus Wallbacteria bacterium]
MSACELILKCPACEGNSRYLLDWEYSGLNDSIFNYTARLFECPDCGLVYNSNIKDQDLAHFYANECSYFEKTHFNILAPENITKFKCYTEILSDSGLSDTPVTDIGCGRGGFLIWLKKNNWQGHCQGVDIDLKSIPGLDESAGTRGKRIDFLEGQAVSLPFADGSQSLLTYFHVLEHIVALNKVLEEAFRVLSRTGYLMIEVPDAEKYKDYPIGSAFWLSIREHVYHYSPDSICNALGRNGFNTISISRNMLPTPEFSYPSLIILARKGGRKKSTGKCKRQIASFTVRSKEELKTQALKVQKFCSRISLPTFWGCSAELFSLLPLMNLQQFRLCDSSRIKQKCTYKGTPVVDPAAVPRNGTLIVAPYLFGAEIEQAALLLGWPKEAIIRLR